MTQYDDEAMLAKLKSAFKKPSASAPVAPTSERLVTIQPPVKQAIGTALPPRPQVSAPPTPPPSRFICDLCGDEVAERDTIEVENVGLCCRSCADTMLGFEQAAVEQAAEEAAVEALLADRRAMPEDTIDGHPVPGSGEPEQDIDSEITHDGDLSGVGWTAGREMDAILATPASDPIMQVLSAEVIPAIQAQAEVAVGRAIEQAEALERAGYGGPDGITRAAQAIREYITYIDTQFIGRADMIETMALATIAQMHAVYIGPAGAAKSQVIGRYMRGIEHVTTGGHQGNSFTTPDELVGPISMAEIETSDRYVRKLEGRIGAVQLYELDEGFKLTNKSFNFLLRALNEREIYNPEQQKIPLHSCFVASNEYPSDPELRALRDRFALKMFLDYVTAEQFISMMRLKQDAESEVTVDWAAFERLVSEVNRLEDEPTAIPDRVMELLLDLRTHLAGERVQVSDRLFRWSKRILIARALLDGRVIVGTQDLWALQHVLWDDAKDRTKVKAALETLIGKLDQTLAEMETMIDSVAEGWAKYVNSDEAKGGSAVTATNMRVRGETMSKIGSIGNTLVQIGSGESMTAEQRARFEALVAKLDALRRAVNPVKGVTVTR